MVDQMDSLAGAMNSPPKKTRPRNRRAQILGAASELFAARGYPLVSMADIAHEVGIAPSALYRHFRSKQELLVEVVLQIFVDFREALDAVGGSDLQQVLDTLAVGVVRRPAMGVLWQREARALTAAGRERLSDELRAIASRLAGAVERARPDITTASADLLAWATLSALMSVSYNDVSLPERPYVDILTRASQEVVGTVLPSLSDKPDCAAPTHCVVVRETRDSLLAAANRLFSQRGYDAVSVEDIGAELGLAGPALYYHFSSKVDLLLVAVNEVSERMRTDLEANLAECPQPRVALHALVRSYVQFCLESDSTVALLITETGNLPDHDRRRLHDAQLAYRDEWVRLLRQAVPEWTDDEARTRAQAVLTMVNDVSRTPHLRAYSELPEALASIGDAILHITPH
jgi:AcrR family transcriptional regulator